MADVLLAFDSSSRPGLDFPEEGVFVPTFPLTAPLRWLAVQPSAAILGMASDVRGLLVWRLLADVLSCEGSIQGVTYER